MSTRVGMLITCVIFANVCMTGAFLVSDGLHRVNTKYGEIVGHIENVQFDGKTSQVAKFLGIPFAEPPVGNLRFRKPVPILQMPTSFIAQSYGPACIQEEYLNLTYSEDCLYLNIFLPLTIGQSGILLKPVMVWIHGGGFITGSAHPFEGNVLSAFADVVVVTIQYRLGPVGFFSTHDEHARGNYGVWDQHQALKWVRDNIHSFGGDTNNITIFGESAGSSSVIYQTMYHGNDGVFKRAIAESGSINSWAVTTKEANYNASLTFAHTIGCDSSAHSEVLKCLRSKSISEVKAMASKLQNFTNTIHPTKWVPVYDGDFVITDPVQLLDKASDSTLSSSFDSFRDKDLMIGANNYDGGVLFPELYDIRDPNINVSFDDIKMKYIPNLIPFVYKEAASELSIDAVMNEYRYYNGMTNAMESLLRMSTDAALNAPTIKTARAHCMGNQAHTYVYQFGVKPPFRFIPLPSAIDDDAAVANHADEVLYVFGLDPSMVQAQDVKASDIHMSKLIMTAWSNFARSGDPNLPRSLDVMANVQWRPYSQVAENYLEISPTMTRNSTKMSLAARGVAFWTDILPRLLNIGKKVPGHLTIPLPEMSPA